MIDWMIRAVVAVSGMIAGWFIARDSANFGLVQLTVSLLLVVLCIIAAVFWPNLVSLFKSSSGHDDTSR